MHAQFTGSFALVSPVLLQDVHDEALFEFTHGLRIKYAAAVHLRYECFELVLHRVSSLSRCANLLFLSLRSKPPGSFLQPQLLLLLLQTARRVFGLATYSLICRSRTRPTAEFDDPGTKLLADIIRGQPTCAVSRHQKVACQL